MDVVGHYAERLLLAPRFGDERAQVISSLFNPFKLWVMTLVIEAERKPYNDEDGDTQRDEQRDEQRDT